MRSITSQITGFSIVCPVVCLGADQRKHQCSASLTFVRGIQNVSIWCRHHGFPRPIIFVAMATVFKFGDWFPSSLNEVIKFIRISSISGDRRAATKEIDFEIGKRCNRLFVKSLLLIRSFWNRIKWVTICNLGRKTPFDMPYIPSLIPCLYHIFYWWFKDYVIANDTLCSEILPCLHPRHRLVQDNWHCDTRQTEKPSPKII